jgi:hypothetical protein
MSIRDVATSVPAAAMSVPAATVPLLVLPLAMVWAADTPIPVAEEAAARLPRVAELLVAAGATANCGLP